MRVVLKKIDGVRDVNVSLKEGVATVEFAPDNRVKLAQIWQGVRDNGFTPRNSTIRAVGVVTVRRDTVVVTVLGSEDSFIVQNADNSSDRVVRLRALSSGTRVTVTGNLDAAPSKLSDARPVLHVVSFSTP